MACRRVLAPTARVAIVLSGLLHPVVVSAQNLALGPALEVVGAFHLEETDEALVGAPLMAPDPLGGWIYWDGQSHDARLYSPTGSLLATFGRPGEGPGEFNGLVGVTRVGDGRLVAIDTGGRGSVWAESGDSLLHDFLSGGVSPYGLAPIGDDAVVVVSSPSLVNPGESGSSAVRTVDLNLRVSTWNRAH